MYLQRSFFLSLHLGLALALALVSPLSAAWPDDIGFTRLKLLAEAELPTAPVAGLAQTEALDNGNYAPNTASPLFAGKTFVLKSGASETSNHAQTVAGFFYGSGSLLPGNCGVDLYSASDWLGSGFLQYPSNSPPLVEPRAVQNHSWIGNLDGGGAADTETIRRLDFAINRDGFTSVVGVNNDNNGTSTTLPLLLCQSYHTISVGRTDGKHTAGFTTFDGSGRIKPDLVAPATATSFSTPMVAGAAGLLHAKLVAAPYSLVGRDLPRVTKALLLASARKDTVPSWSNTPTRPLDLRYGAGELNIHHAYHALRAGRSAASGNSSSLPRGWAAESVAGNSSKTYFFTIPPDAPSTPFCAALTWHRVITSGKKGNQWGELTSTLADLNLRLRHANGFTIGALVEESLSSVDNVELVAQAALPPGDYALVVENSSATSTEYALAWHSLPAVTAAATVPVAREIDGQAAIVTISRSGDTALPLRVPLVTSGDAISGSHYLPLPADITIPAGQTSFALEIVPIADQLAQGDRLVTVAIGADFALVRDPLAAAGVIIEDKPFDAWRFANFTASELADPLISGELADPDHDGLANLIEYALGLDPRAPGVSPVLAGTSNDQLTLAADKNPAATDIVWSAEISVDLESWLPAVIVTDSPTNFVAASPVAISAVERQFIRLRIDRP